MKFFFFLILILPSSASYSSDNFNNNSLLDEYLHDAFITKNTVRERPGDWAYRSILKLSMGCVGFFVKNNKNKIYVATARHCVAYEMTKACINNSFTLKTMIGEHIGVCKKVVVGTGEDDMIIIEVEFPNKRIIQDFFLPLTIASYFPEQWTRLNLIGFPTDYYRKGKFTSATNCWVNNNIDGFNIKIARNHLTTRQYRENQAEYNHRVQTGVTTPSLSSQIKPINSYFNCSVYGGNSGGPILVEGSTEVVGIPNAFLPNSSGSKPRVFNYNYMEQFETTYGFVKRNASTLKKAGVIIGTHPMISIEDHIEKTNSYLRGI